MTFKITDLKKPAFDGEIIKQISHDGLELALCIKKDDDFFSAIGRIQGLIENEKNIKNILKRGQMASYEALLFVIGEYVVSEWNVTDENDKPLAINGDNLLLVLDSVPNLKEFIDLLMTEFNSAMTDFTNMVEELKKKSSNATNGKKLAKN